MLEGPEDPTKPRLVRSGPSATFCTEWPASTTHAVVPEGNLDLAVSMGWGEDRGTAGQWGGGWGGAYCKTTTNVTPASIKQSVSIQ